MHQTGKRNLKEETDIKQKVKNNPKNDICILAHIYGACLTTEVEEDFDLTLHLY